MCILLLPYMVKRQPPMHTPRAYVLRATKSSHLYAPSPSACPRAPESQSLIFPSHTALRLLHTFPGSNVTAGYKQTSGHSIHSGKEVCTYVYPWAQPQPNHSLPRHSLGTATAQLRQPHGSRRQYIQCFRPASYSYVQPELSLVHTRRRAHMSSMSIATR